jgi:hypothetical protein
VIVLVVIVIAAALEVKLQWKKCEWW